MVDGRWTGPRPQTRYAEANRGYIGYQVFGEGDRDIVFVNNAISNIDAIWDEPSAVRFLDRLGGMGRVILYDMRGSGVSDPVSDRTTWHTVEENVDDIVAVIDAAGADRVVAYGDTEGGLFATMLAASHPSRVERLILVNTFAYLLRQDDYPIGIPPATAQALSDEYTKQHGTTGDMLSITAPSMVDDIRFKTWWTRYQRLSVPLGLAKTTFEWFGLVDVRAALPLISAPTLVVTREDARFHRASFGRYIADHIDGAEYRELPGTDTLPFHAGDFEPVLDQVERFLTGSRSAPHTDRMLATVVFTDIVDSTARAAAMGDARWRDLLAAHDNLVRAEVERFRGSVIEVNGDSSLSTFDGPARAIACASAIETELAKIGVPIRAGIHTGEVERTDAGIRGLAVHIASRVMSAAGEGGVVTSRTVKDLAVGSDLRFDELGAFDLKGVPGRWELFRLRRP